MAVCFLFNHSYRYMYTCALFTHIHFHVVCGKCIIYTEPECYNLPQQPVISSVSSQVALVNIYTANIHRHFHWGFSGRHGVSRRNENWCCQFGLIKVCINTFILQDWFINMYSCQCTWCSLLSKKINHELIDKIYTI